MKARGDSDGTSTTGNLGRIYCVCGGTPTIIEGVLRCSNCLRKME